MNLNSLNELRGFWNLVREINPEDLEREAAQPFRILVIAADLAVASMLADAFNGGHTFPASPVQALCFSESSQAHELPKADLVIYALPEDQVGDYETARKISEMETQGQRVLLAIYGEGNEQDAELASSLSNVFFMLPPHRVVVMNPKDTEQAIARLWPAVMATLPHLRLSLGRSLPPFRAQVATSLILETSRANAEFALLTSLPGSVPIVGGLFQTGADLLVLTKNQIMLVLKLAILYGRGHNSKMRTIAEIAPVVGGAFFWRTMARTVIDLLPGFIAAVPKTLIAFVGTFVVGQIARYYYEVGQKPASRVLAKIYDDALIEARAFLRLKDK